MQQRASADWWSTAPTDTCDQRLPWRHATAAVKDRPHLHQLNVHRSDTLLHAVRPCHHTQPITWFIFTAYYSLIPAARYMKSVCKTEWNFSCLYKTLGYSLICVVRRLRLCTPGMCEDRDECHLEWAREASSSQQTVEQLFDERSKQVIPAWTCMSKVGQQ